MQLFNAYTDNISPSFMEQMHMFILLYPTVGKPCTPFQESVLKMSTPGPGVIITGAQVQAPCTLGHSIQCYWGGGVIAVSYSLCPVSFNKVLEEGEDQRINPPHFYHTNSCVLIKCDSFKHIKWSPKHILPLPEQRDNKSLQRAPLCSSKHYNIFSYSNSL